MTTRPGLSGSGVVGPNAVIQLGDALEDLFGPQTARAVFAEVGYADLIDNPPDRMISEEIPACLMTQLWRSLKPGEANAAAAEAGRRTADYVIKNRIPRVAGWFLASTPRPLGARMLLKSIQRNAWTFCGSGVCTIGTDRALSLTLAKNPIRTPGCIWHVAVFERLFKRLVSRRTTVKHSIQRVKCNPVDRFVFSLV